jgi:alanyl-tRNA synthetase
MGAVVAPLLSLADARGGGRAGRAQGSGKNLAGIQAFLDAVAAAVRP